VIPEYVSLQVISVSLITKYPYAHLRAMEFVQIKKDARKCLVCGSPSYQIFPQKENATLVIPATQTLDSTTSRSVDLPETLQVTVFRCSKCGRLDLYSFGTSIEVSE